MTAKIRWMIRRDVPEVLNIEMRSFDFPWAEKDFINCLRQRTCIGAVYERNDQILAFMVYKLSKGKLTLLNFAVHPEFRRQGIGTQMIEKLRMKLSLQRRQMIDLHVSDDNLTMQLFLRKVGFKAKRIEPHHYKEHQKDAYYFNYSAVEEQEVTAKLSN